MNRRDALKLLAAAPLMPEVLGGAAPVAAMPIIFGLGKPYEKRVILFSRVSDPNDWSLDHVTILNLPERRHV